jgi:hypothetical protein
MNSAVDEGEWSVSHPGHSLPLGKGPLVRIVEEAGQAPELVWTQRLEERSFAPAGYQTPIARSSSPYWLSYPGSLVSLYSIESKCMREFWGGRLWYQNSWKQRGFAVPGRLTKHWLEYFYVEFCSDYWGYCQWKHLNAARMYTGLWLEGLVSAGMKYCIYV